MVGICHVFIVHCEILWKEINVYSLTLYGCTLISFHNQILSIISNPGRPQKDHVFLMLDKPQGCQIPNQRFWAIQFLTQNYLEFQRQEWMNERLSMTLGDVVYRIREEYFR